jgi:hypothetical protein
MRMERNLISNYKVAYKNGTKYLVYRDISGITHITLTTVTILIIIVNEDIYIYWKSPHLIRFVHTDVLRNRKIQYSL